KAGDEVYANVMRALLERHETGRGAEIHVSMLQAAASWLTTVLPLLDFDCAPGEVTRAGNEHRKFIPTNVYPASDGFVYLAIGSDVQWRRLTAIPKFAPLANEVRAVRGRLTRTTTPDGRVVRMQPMAVDVEGAHTELPFPPKYGADTRRVLGEAGYDPGQIERLVAEGVAA